MVVQRESNNCTSMMATVDENIAIRWGLLYCVVTVNIVDAEPAPTLFTAITVKS
jgi:hypothetical protein